MNHPITNIDEPRVMDMELIIPMELPTDTLEYTNEKCLPTTSNGNYSCNGRNYTFDGDYFCYKASSLTCFSATPRLLHQYRQIHKAISAVIVPPSNP